MLQSLARAADANVGLHLSVPRILGLALLVGGTWGLLWLHLVSGSVYLVSRVIERPLPFRQLRAAVALSTAPQLLALSAWLVGSLLVGANLFTDQNQHLGTLPPSTLIQVGLLYVGTGVSILWSLVIAILAVRELRGGSALGAFGLLVSSALTLGVAVMIVAAIVFFVISFRFASS